MDELQAVKRELRVTQIALCAGLALAVLYGEGRHAMTPGPVPKITESSQAVAEPEKERIEASVPSPPPKSRTNSLGMRLIRIEPGSFMMGTSESDITLFKKLWPDFNRDSVRIEQPNHTVRVEKPFYLGAYEVTVGQFGRFVTEAGYKVTDEKLHGYGYDSQVPWNHPAYSISADQPAASLSWHDAKAFCTWLSKKENLLYRLPTEVEWEYACRAGSTTIYPYGNEDADLGEYAWYSANSGGKTHPVGQKKPNAWGLYDMLGNVGEFCQDAYDNYDPDPHATATTDFHQPENRIIRGAGFQYESKWCRSADRLPVRAEPNGVDALVDPSVGFRVVLESD